MKTCKLEATWDMMGRVRRVRGPAFESFELPVGAPSPYGGVSTKYTSDWARRGYRKLVDCVTMERPRQSGHEIEGYVRIRGKRYSAFTSGGDDGKIIVRRR